MRSLFLCGALAALALLAGGCAGGAGRSSQGSFAEARGVLERNCLHCHGKDRLTQMPAFTDTHALARLMGPGGWIVRGSPEQSRLFQVVTLADSQTGAMPPTGHAIAPADVATLRAWIAAGAPLPKDPPIALRQQGDGPRSW